MVGLRVCGCRHGGCVLPRLRVGRDEVWCLVAMAARRVVTRAEGLGGAWRGRRADRCAALEVDGRETKWDTWEIHIGRGGGGLENRGSHRCMRT